MQNNLESLLNEVSEIKNALNDIRSILMNTKAKGNARKPLKKPLNASLFLNATNKLCKTDDLFDFSKIEYNEGSIITFSEFYNACCLDKSVQLNVVSRLFKQSSFYKSNNIFSFRTSKHRGFRNIRLRLDTSNQQI